MQNIRVGLMLRDHDFAVMLAESLARESRQLCFTVSDKLDCNDEWDVVLTDYDKGVNNQVVLVDSLNDENLTDGQYRIFKYKSASDMVKTIAYIVYEITGDTIICKEDSSLSVISVCSATGGSGVSEVAKGLCRVLFDCFDKRCVYVNLSAHCNNESEEYDEGLFRKLIYYLKYKDNFPVDYFLKSEERYEYISRGKLAIYQEEFSSEVCTRFVCRLRKVGKWKYVVIDCGNYINQEKINIINSSDYVLQVTDGRRNDSENYDFLQDYLQDDDKNIIRILNFVSVSDEIPNQLIDLQNYENIADSADFQYKMSLIGQMVGGEIDD